jgi:hypothetical protein
MNQVKGRVHAFERVRQGGRFQDVALDSLRGDSDARAEELRLPGQTPNVPPLRFELLEDTPADVAGSAGE